MAFLVNSDNHEKFAISIGETLIGRGPYLRVKELVLSRSHAVVLLNNSKVSIKPIHKNPTYFYSPDLVENGVALEKDKWKELEDGDSISLLPNSYKYHVEITCSQVSDGNHMQGNRDTQVGKEENENGAVEESVNKPNSPYLSTTLCDADSHCIINENNAVDALSSNENEPVCMESVIVSPKSSLKRKLPSWMLETESPGKKKKIAQRKPTKKGQDTCPLKVTSPVKSPATSDTPHMSSDEPNEQNIPNPISDLGTNNDPAKQVSQVETSPLHESCYEIHNKDEQTVPVSVIANIAQDEETSGESLHADRSHVAQTVLKSAIVDMFQDEHTSAKSPAAEISEGEHAKQHDLSDDEQVAVKSPVGEICQDEHSNNSFVDDQQKYSDVEENVECKEASSHSSEQQVASGDLKPCPYGKRCYRKNPAHFEEYSHHSKGHDDDDDDGDQNSDGNKSECPYGMKCYRQNNPYHTSKYTHTSIGKERTARRSRRPHKKRGKSLLDKESDNDGENEYDFNDSFIASTDDSGGYSDDSGDSDYVPPGHSDNEEDLNELVSEAKGFIRNTNI